MTSDTRPTSPCSPDDADGARDVEVADDDPAVVDAEGMISTRDPIVTHSIDDTKEKLTLTSWLSGPCRSALFAEEESRGLSWASTVTEAVSDVADSDGGGASSRAKISGSTMDDGTECPLAVEDCAETSFTATRMLPMYAIALPPIVSAGAGDMLENSVAGKLATKPV